MAGARRIGPAAPSLAIGVALLAALPISGPVHAPLPTGGAGRAARDLATAVNLTVSPADWWLAGGGSVELTAVWTGLPPACAADPLWFAWSVGPGPAEGTLSPANRSVVNFTSVSAASGATGLSVTAAVTVTCDSNQTQLLRSATSVVRVDAPLSLIALHLAGGPTISRGNLSVVGFLGGGEPPFAIQVEWGNGASTGAVLNSSGNFSVAGVPGTGPLDPVVIVTDAAGQVLRARPEENSSGGPPFVLAVVPSTYVADVGRPVAFRLVSNVAAANYSFIAECPGSVAASSFRADPKGPTFTCAFATPGLANVSVVAVDYDAAGATAYVQLREPVEPGLNVQVPPAGSGAEVGRSAYVRAVVAGGVPPLHLTWSWLGADSGSTESIGQDGSVLLALGPSTAGSDELVVRATDELGESSSNVSSSTAVEPPLAGGGAVSVSSSGPGARVDVSGWVEAGDAPFDWTIVPQGSVTAESPGGGTLPTVGTFRWNASSADPARFAATLFLIDAEGARVAYPISATGGSGLSVGIVAGPAGLGHWSGVVTVVGGSPPFRSWANASDGRSWNRSNLSNRSWPVSGSTSGPGNLSVVVTVVDRYGDRAVAETAFVVPATARSRPYAAEALGGVLGAGLLGGGAYAYWRRRARATPGPEVADPVAVLRSIIAPADGIERSTAEQLAEEEGVPRERARATLDRLVADGSVRAERGVDGEEILAWRPIP